MLYGLKRRKSDLSSFFNAHPAPAVRQGRKIPEYLKKHDFPWKKVINILDKGILMS